MLLLYLLTLLCLSSHFISAKGDDLNTSLSTLENEISKAITNNADVCKVVGVCGPCHCIEDVTIPRKHTCDCQALPSKQDCLQFFMDGMRVDGIYTVFLHDKKNRNSESEYISVYCDQNTDGGGWMVFQKRFNGAVNFTRNWDEYGEGFGYLNNEFYLGNMNLRSYLLPRRNPKGNEIRFDMQDFQGKKIYAKYSMFAMESFWEKYRISVSGKYLGDAGDSFGYHDGGLFSTYDKDNDKSRYFHCAQDYHSGWWYGSCFQVNLNGVYKPNGVTLDRQGLNWRRHTGEKTSLKATEMKVRRKL